MLPTMTIDVVEHSVEKSRDPVHGRALPRVAVVLCASVVLAACSSGFEVTIPADATIDGLRFMIGDFKDRRLGVVPSSVGVYRCESIQERPRGNYYPGDSEAVWLARVIALEAGEATDRISYGIDGHGLQTQRPPEALLPGGCYVVLVYGRAVEGRGRVGTAGFNVLSNRRVVQMKAPEYERVFSKSR
jgi:hypothetical protein